MQHTLIYIVILAFCAFVISLVISFIFAKRRAAKKVFRLSEFAENVFPNSMEYQYVLSGHTEIIDHDEMKNGDDYDYKYYLVGFKKWELAVSRCEVKSGQLKFEPVKLYNTENLSDVKIRYMRTNTQLFDNDGNMVCELTVPQLSTKQIYDDFPVDIDQNDDALTFYDFIENFEAIITKNKNTKED